jgi:hypothetical protein
MTVPLSPLGGRAKYPFRDVAPQLIAAFYTTAVLGCVQGLVACLFATDPAVPHGVLLVIRVVVAVDEGFVTEVGLFGSVLHSGVGKQPTYYRMD